MHAQTIEAANWWARPRGVTAGEWVANYQRSLNTRHRTVIAEAMRGLAPESVLEVGCHCGPNLMRLAGDLPGVMLSGVDASEEAIRAGEAWARQLGVSDRVEFKVGRVPGVTASLPDGCVDVVLSCYTLAYVAPQDLDAVLYEMGRLARTAVVIAEPMSETGSTVERRAASGYTEWAHNYGAAQQWVGTVRGLAGELRSVSPPVDRLSSVLTWKR